MKLYLGVFLLAIAFVGAEVNISLEGSKVFNVLPITQNHVKLINELETTLAGVDIWQRASVLGREARIMVSKKSQDMFKVLMKSAGVPINVSVEDVAQLLENERQTNDIAKSRLPKDSKISFTAFHRHDEINAYLDSLAAQYPTKVTVRTLGNTFEGRALKAIVISTTGGNDASKPVIISDAGIHAREWAAPALSLYIITKLVEDITESDVVDNIDWVIIPVLNADGYEYTHTTTRLWRKTRSTFANSTCLGADANRNFDYHFNESGVSSDPCSDIYNGVSAFSEPETQYVRDLFTQYEGRVKAYLAIHSYGSYFLYPFSHNGLPTSDEEELNAVGKQVAAAIDAASLPGSANYLATNFAIGLRYFASGTSADYAYGVGGVKLSYTIELPGRDTGFEMPPSLIMHTVQETWQGILVLARYVIAN